MKKIFGFLLAAIIIGLTAFTLLSPAANVAPSFELTDLNGKTVNNQNLHGRVTLINFWSQNGKYPLLSCLIPIKVQQNHL